MSNRSNNRAHPGLPHKYYQVNVYGKDVWTCALPDCYHYMPYHMRNMMVGKKSLCWGCESEIRLYSGNMEMTKPCCEQCKGTENDPNLLIDKLVNEYEQKQNQ